MTATRQSEDLDAALDRIECIRIAPVTAPPGAVAFGFSDELLPDPRATIARHLDRISRKITNYAEINTPHDTPHARTTVSWGGNFGTVVTAFATPGNFQEHAETVGRNLSRRAAFLRIFTAASVLAVAISAATANPVAIPAAFRAGWKLVTELERIQ